MPTVKRKPRPPTEWVKQVPETLAAWGRGPFSPPDDADGVRIDGVVLRRAPDGTLYAITETKPEMELE